MYRFNTIEEITPLVHRILHLEKETRCIMTVRFNGVLYFLRIDCKEEDSLDKVMFEAEEAQKNLNILTVKSKFALPGAGEKVFIHQWRDEPASDFEAVVVSTYVDEDGDFCIVYSHESTEHYAVWSSTDLRWDDGEHPYIPE